MKKSDELKQKLASLEAENKELVSKESRSVEENEKVDAYLTEYESIEKEIERAIKLERVATHVAARNGKKMSDKEEKEAGNYSFARVIKLLGEGRTAEAIDGYEGEMNQEGVNERKSLGIATKGFTIPMMVLERSSTGQNVTTAADGGNLVQDMSASFIESLKNAMVLYQMGATFQPGLTGNLPLVKAGAFTASWVAEGSDVTTTKFSTSKATLSPHNLMVAGALSKQLMLQAPGVAEQMVRKELIGSIAQGLQAAAINGSGTGATPTGILNYVGIGSVAGGTNGAAPTWKHVVDLESAVANDNAVFSNPGYLTNTKVRGILKQTLKAASVAGYIWDGQGMNGYKADITNAVPSDLDKGSSTGVCSPIIFGYFSELFIGMWGGLDIIVDPYTLKKRNELEIVCNQFADVALRNAESFAAIKDVLTT